MADLIKWLTDRDLTNPHSIPNKYKKEFELAFPKEDYTILWPQPGGQEQFANCEADVVVYGGEAGGGKSWNLLFDHMKWTNLKNYIGVVVRKLNTQIFDAGGLWEEALKMYPEADGAPKLGQKPKFVFPGGAQIYFKHSQLEQRLKILWQGLQAAVISVDELTHFSKKEFLYFCGRNRSTCGVKPYVRATCNPDPDSWVKEFIQWWIKDDGFIDDDRCGIIRWFVHVDDKFVFADTKEELESMFDSGTLKFLRPMTMTFIRGKLDENRKLLDEDPDYRARLEMQTEEEKMALSRGNWNVVNSKDRLFNKDIINKYRVEKNEIELKDVERVVTGCDPAGTSSEENDMVGIVTCGIKEIDGEMHGYVFLDTSGHYKPDEWSINVCTDYHIHKADLIIAEKNFGGDMVESTIRSYDKNINILLSNSSKGKWVRAEPVAGLYNRGLIHHVGHDLEELELEMCSFRRKQTKSPNRLDACVFALTELLLSDDAKIANIKTF